MLKFKSNVRIGYLDTRLGEVLRLASLWSLRMRIDIEVNSINDGSGQHMTGSLHHFDLAVDLDTDGEKPTDLEDLAEYFRRSLDPQYDVVFEKSHVHIEWDARRPAPRRAL